MINMRFIGLMYTDRGGQAVERKEALEPLQLSIRTKPNIVRCSIALFSQQLLVDPTL